MKKKIGFLLFLASWLTAAALFVCGDLALTVFLAALLAALMIYVVSLRYPAASRGNLALTSILSTLLLADVILRFAGQGLFYFRPHDRFIHIYSRFPAVARFKTNASFDGWSYGDLADMTADKSLRQWRRERFQTDSLGFRDEPGSSQRPHQVIVLADSFGVGVGTTQDLIWARMLETRHGLSTYNLSMIGSPWQHFVNLQLEYERLQIAPGATILLTVFPGNDLDEYYEQATRINEGSLLKPLDSLPVAWSTFQNRSPIHLMLGRFFTKGDPGAVIVKDIGGLGKLLFYKNYYFAQQRSYEDVVRHPHFPLMSHTILDLKKYADERSLVLRVALVPSKEEAYGWLWRADRKPSAAPSGFSRALSEICRKGAIPFHDLTPAITQEARRRYDAGELLWWKDDSHPNELGHQLIADEMARFISSAPLRAGR